MSSRVDLRKITGRVFRWTGWILLSLIIIIVSVVLLLSTQWGAGLLRKGAESYLRKKLGTELAIGGLKLDGLRGISLYDVLLRDQKRDTLLSFDTLSVAFNPEGLTQQKLRFPEIRVANLVAGVDRPAGNSNFNFQFIVDAFSSGKTNADTSTGSSWDIAFEKISLRHIRFRWSDQQDNSLYQVSFADLTLDLRKTDLNSLSFDATSVWLDGLEGRIRLPAGSSTEQDTGEAGAGNAALALVADKLTLTNTRFNLNMPSDSLSVDTRARLLVLDNLQYNAASSYAGASLLVLDDHHSEVWYKTSTPGPATAVPVKAGGEKPGQSFTLRVDSVALLRNSVSADDRAYPARYRDRFDPHHVAADSLLLKASGLQYDAAGYRARIHELSFRDQNGFLLKKLQGDAAYSDTSLSVRDLVLETRQNRLQGSADLRFTSAGEIMTRPDRTRLQVSIKPARLRLDELAYFSPDMRTNKNLQPLLTREILVELAARGTLDKLELTSYRVSTGANILRGSATVMYPTNPDKLVADVRLAELGSTRKDLQSLLPSGLLPDSAWTYIPERFTIQGRLQGSMQHIQSDLGIRSSVGAVSIKGYIDQPADKLRAKYDLSLTADGLAINRIIGDTTLGTVSGQVDIAGTGYDPETMVASVEANLSEAGYSGYAYQDIRLSGRMDQGDIAADIRSADPNIDLDANLALHYGKKIGNLKVKADIRQLDLLALGFVDSALAIHGKADLDFPVLDSARIEGNGMLNDLAITMGARNFFLDTVSILAETRLDSQYIKLKSPLADLEIFGQYSLQAMPDAARTIVANLLRTTGETIAFAQPLYAEFKGTVHIADSMAALLPGLKKIAPFGIEGGLDTRSNLLVFKSMIPRLEYRDYTADSILLAVLQRPEDARFRKAQFLAQLSRLNSTSFSLDLSQVRGEIDKGLVNTRILLYDPEKKLRYGLPISYVNDSARPYVFLRDTILLNKAAWHVNPDNRVYLDPKNLQGSNLLLSNGDESLSLKAAASGTDGMPLTVEMHAFHLESIANMLVSDTALVSGVVNGRATMESLSPLRFQANLQADSLTLMGSRYGNLHIESGSRGDEKYAVDLSLLGEGNDFAVKGHYDASNSGLDFRVHMAPLSFQPAARFLEAYADSLTGGIRGDLVIRGTTKVLDITGDLSLDTSSLVLRMTGAPIRITKAGLHFTEDAIVFDGMTIMDRDGRQAAITGEMSTSTITDFAYKLRMQTDRFLVAGKKQYEDQLVSGPLFAGMLLNIDGNLEQANVRGNINVIDSSQIRYVYKSTVSVREGEGLIEFFEPGMSSVPDSLVTKKPVKKKAGFKLAVNSDLKLTSTSTVTIVLDEMTGDQLSAKGNANLNFNMAPDGTMQLTGIYEAESGNYNMTIAGIIKKTFELVKGSTITWSGDILKANANLTAVYKVKTDAQELLQDGQSVSGAGKQKLDFEVYMMIRGEILKPDISFRLDMPEKEQAAFDGVVYTRIKQVNTIPSELNKQVMGLLALGSFIADNPFNSLTSSGGNFETQAFSTAGRLLTQELNDFLGDVVKNVDIDVGLDIRDDYTSGSAKRRSDLKVGFAKSFANNRLSVYVGNTFALENQNQEEDVLNGLAGDVTIEYMLTTDGRYRLKGYRETEEDLTFNGQMVETGVTFVVVIEFNKFKNAFRNKKNRKGTRT